MADTNFINKIAFHDSDEGQLPTFKIPKSTMSATFQNQPRKNNVGYFLPLPRKKVSATFHSMNFLATSSSECRQIDKFPFWPKFNEMFEVSTWGSLKFSNHGHNASWNRTKCTW